MGTFSHFALQKAVYQQFMQDSVLMGMVVGVFDRPAQGTDFPYITIGDSSGLEWSNRETSGMEYKFVIHIWSRQAGRKETVQIMERIYTLLHQQSPPVEDNTLMLMRFVSSSIVLESDGWTTQGQMRFHALLQSEN